MSEYAKEWKDAADTEYQSLVENETWDLVELPRRKSPSDVNGSSR